MFKRIIIGITIITLFLLAGNLIFWHFFDNKGGFFGSPLVNFLEKNISKSNQEVFWSNLNTFKDRVSSFLASIKNNKKNTTRKKNQLNSDKKKENSFRVKNYLKIFKKGLLTIKVLGCSDPVVEVLNIVEEKGCYLVKVSKIGYRTVVLYTCLKAGENKMEIIALEKSV